MIGGFTSLIIGFSVFSAGILLVAYLLFLDDLQKSRIGMAACAALLASLAGLQICHLLYLQLGTDLIASRVYVLLLLMVPPAFYFFSRAVLLPESRTHVWHLAHLIPLSVSFVIPTTIVVPAAFVIGTVYSLWFARLVYGMREQRNRFRIEMFFFGLFVILAVIVLVLGVTAPYVDPGLFHVTYANCIGVAMVLVVAALIIFPDLLTDIAEAARASYATSTLGDVDVAAKLERLAELMNEDRIYQNENLSLPLLATEVGLSAHQLSELINTRFGIGFSRFIREQRVAEAQRLLREDARSSVLAIGMMTGFKSQSNFYAAFREICNESPGSYRRRHGNS